MSGQWKPGDVLTNGSGRRWFVVEAKGRLSTVGTDGFQNPVFDPGYNGRPLAVIDPEDVEAVGRLARESHDRIHKPGSFDDLSPMSQEALGELMQAALREFADPTPPKPDEPQGLGAVVRDAEGKTWVKVGKRSDWYQAHGKWAQYHSIDAVEVLSEGVTP